MLVSLLLIRRKVFLQHCDHLLQIFPAHLFVIDSVLDLICLVHYFLDLLSSHHLALCLRLKLQLRLLLELSLLEDALNFSLVYGVPIVIRVTIAATTPFCLLALLLLLNHLTNCVHNNYLYKTINHIL